ncbi:DegT/DnrJ/EryC1/StrS family aminotransferase [Xanthomarina spongicola]|uniref:Perosamine synthetase n=1 Tax=Xanthomarina spongicola TaxID=570520 RepID=A0A316DLP2_9FLAO|nr:DegT/DnrJ/EryC1/StrS family aminotransferase [Xanthomarina spongicola]PWK18636.1 perosamine synthetase [Xanthomarina spongicola]
MIPVNTPLLNGNEKKYLLECVETGWISSEGPFVRRFEEDIACFVGRQHGIAVSNGSAALDVAIRALNLEKGSEVIMPTFTIISPAQSLVNEGLVPVLIDSDPLTWNMDVNQIEAKITSKTKAILVVHIYGLPVDLDAILSLAKKYQLKIIEDAAEMHGQTYNGKQCGSFGDISIFSFYPNKHITTGEGGMILTDDDELAERCRTLKNLCFKPGRRFVHDELGWNYRMTNMQAALGVAQLENIQSIVERKREIGDRYNQNLKDLINVELPLKSTDYAENIYWVYGLIAKTEVMAIEIQKKLGDNKIGTRPFFWCMHEQPVFNKLGMFLGETYPQAEKLARTGFYIPSGLGLSNAEIDEVSEQIIKAVSYYG